MVVARSTGLPVGMAVQRLGMGLCSLVVALLLMVALFATGSHGQSAHLSAPTFGSSPSGNVFVTYFGDNQNTTATGATSTLPQCTGGNIGQSNLFLRLENTDTGVVLQQVGPFTGITGFLWNTTAIATLTPSFTGLYVCRLYQNSGLLATSTLSYQLNVVVPMSITCQYPPNLRYESLNVLSCNVTGYPLPSITWTQVNGSNTTASWTLNGGIYQVTSTMSFLGNQTRLAAGLLFTISTTAKYPTFNCTPLQTPTAMNICDSTNTSVTVTSEPLQIVAPCPATVFKNTFLSPATPPSTEFGTTFNISCPAGYNNTSNISSLRCQAIGHWTTFPTCAVAMGITCQYPANIKYESLNVLSCNVTGYPLPMISWSGINGTTPTPTLSGGIDGTTTSTSSGGIYKITATNSIWGDQTEFEPGSFVTVHVTAQYPAFNCSPLENPTAQPNLCESIPEVVTYTSKLLVVAACVPFTDTAFIPSIPPSTEYGTNFSIDCAPGYEYRPSTPTIDKMSCQANGSWTPFPTCDDSVNCPGACQDTNATCMDIPGSFECRCNRGYTGSGVTPGSCDLDRCVSSPCNHASATCVNTMSSFFCQCPVSSVGVTNDACKSTVCAALCHDSNSVCQDNGGILSCGCRVGYNGSGLSINSCNNVNECLSSPCQDSLATCLDTEGSFLCRCPEELLGNGLKRGGCSRAAERPGTNSVGLTAGVGCGAFFLGSIITFLITWFLAKRKYGTDQTGNCRNPQVGKPPDGMAMTNSDAYGMVDIPTTQQQQPQYDYVLPEAQ